MDSMESRSVGSITPTQPEGLPLTLSTKLENVPSCQNADPNPPPMAMASSPSASDDITVPRPLRHPNASPAQSTDPHQTISSMVERVTALMDVSHGSLASVVRLIVAELRALIKQLSSSDPFEIVSSLQILTEMILMHHEETLGACCLATSGNYMRPFQSTPTSPPSLPHPRHLLDELVIQLMMFFHPSMVPSKEQGVLTAHCILGSDLTMHAARVAVSFMDAAPKLATSLLLRSGFIRASMAILKNPEDMDAIELIFKLFSRIAQPPFPSSRTQRHYDPALYPLESTLVEALQEMATCDIIIHLMDFLNPSSQLIGCKLVTSFVASGPAGATQFLNAPSAQQYFLSLLEASSSNSELTYLASIIWKQCFAWGPVPLLETVLVNESQAGLGRLVQLSLRIPLVASGLVELINKSELITQKLIEFNLLNSLLLQISTQSTSSIHLSPDHLKLIAGLFNSKMLTSTPSDLSMQGFVECLLSLPRSGTLGETEIVGLLMKILGSCSLPRNRDELVWSELLLHDLIVFSSYAGRKRWLCDWNRKHPGEVPWTNSLTLSISNLPCDVPEYQFIRLLVQKFPNLTARHGLSWNEVSDRIEFDSSPAHVPESVLEMTAWEFMHSKYFHELEELQNLREEELLWIEKCSHDLIDRWIPWLPVSHHASHGGKVPNSLLSADTLMRLIRTHISFPNDNGNHSIDRSRTLESNGPWSKVLFQDKAQLDSDQMEEEEDDVEDDSEDNSDDEVDDSEIEDVNDDEGDEDSDELDENDEKPRATESENDGGAENHSNFPPTDATTSTDNESIQSSQSPRSFFGRFAMRPTPSPTSSSFSDVYLNIQAIAPIQSIFDFLQLDPSSHVLVHKKKILLPKTSLFKVAWEALQETLQGRDRILPNQTFAHLLRLDCYPIDSFLSPEATEQLVPAVPSPLQTILVFLAHLHSAFPNIVALPCSNLTRLLQAEMQDVFMSATQCLPHWVTWLLQPESTLNDASNPHWRFLIPFEIRKQYFERTCLGYARSILNTTSATPSSSSATTLGRIQRQKVKIDRDQVIPCAFKVMDLFASEYSLLEIEYLNEVGTGLGPTLEFYSLIIKASMSNYSDLWMKSSQESPWLMPVPGCITEADIEALIQLYPESQNRSRGTSGLILTPKHLMAREQSTRPARCSVTASSPTPPVSTAHSSTSGLLHAKLLRLLGQTVAKAMVDHRVIDAPLHPHFLSLVFHPITGRYTLDQIKSIDPMLAQSLQMIRDVAMSSPLSDATPIPELQEMHLHFEYEGHNLEKEGQDRMVLTRPDALQYVDDVIQWIGYGGHEAAIRAFQLGFGSVISIPTMSTLFSIQDLSTLLGNAQVTEDRTQQWTYPVLHGAVRADHGYTKDAPRIHDLIQLLCSFDIPTRKLFLQFVTGSSRLPLGGWTALQPPFTIVLRPADDPDQYLPSVMTCANYLKLPNYSSAEVLKSRLLFAIQEGQGCFHLS
jgi:hypothetical protein